ncbi:MAG: hypothetical protein LBJ57_06310 [Prevotellaceae bacterium]|jgi:hypothetical protein|nr:hypothetical protein [Prevotellaceae bacterium]
MKKWMLALACMVITVAACQKDEDSKTDFEQGKQNGKTFCDCLAGGQSPEQCATKLDLNKMMEAQIAIRTQRQITDYVAGLITAPCMVDMVGSMMGDTADNFDNLFE